MDEEDLRIIINLFLILVGLFIFALLVFGLIYQIESKKCLDSYSNYSPQFEFWTGCRIMVNGKLTPTDIVRELN